MLSTLLFKMVDDADVYIGIFGHRYGHVPKGYDISITEMEYNRAVQQNKSRLIFFIDSRHQITIADVETGSGADKLAALKLKIGNERVVAYFTSPQDLRGHVVEALSNLNKLEQQKDRCDNVVYEQSSLHRLISIPIPPEPYIAHPYTLLQLRDLAGRKKELTMMTEWVANPASEISQARIFCFVAIGGMGKSALTWKWFNQIAPNEISGLEGCLWWSFYESDATFENFLNRALCYVSGASEEEMRVLSWPERENKLLRYLNKRKFLLCLDGFERALIAYNRMDAGYLADDDYDRQTANRVAGAIGLPPSASQSFVGQHQLRHTTDPRAGAFLQKFAQVSASRILMTTRLFPSALQLPNGKARPGALAYVFCCWYGIEKAFVIMEGIKGIRIPC